jgi:hypothetical protein
MWPFLFFSCCEGFRTVSLRTIYARGLVFCIRRGRNGEFAQGKSRLEGGGVRFWGAVERASSVPYYTTSGSPVLGR